MDGRMGPETIAILKALKEVQLELARTRVAMVGIYEPTSIVYRGGLYHDQRTISKAALFTDTEISTQGFNLVQISSDGNLSDITYKMRYLDGRVGDSVLAVNSPHIVGHTLAVLVTNLAAEAGRTVYVDRYLAPWAMLAAIKHGTPQYSILASGDRLFYAEKVEYASSALNYFETDEPLAGGAPTLSMDGSPAEAKIEIEAIRYQFTPTNAVTYQLYLLDDAQAVAERRESNVLYDSGAGKTSGTINVEVPGAKLSIMCNLATAGRIYYMIDWSAAPGDTTGYIKVYGRVMR